MSFDNSSKFDLSSSNQVRVKVYVPTPSTAHTQPAQLAVKLQDASSSITLDFTVLKSFNNTNMTFGKNSFLTLAVNLQPLFLIVLLFSLIVKIITKQLSDISMTLN